MRDFILNGCVRKSCRWIGCSIYPRSAQDSIFRTIATGIVILPVIVVKPGGANVTEVAQNQAIVRRAHERAWRFPEDSIDLRCIHYIRITRVLPIAALLAHTMSSS